jgi:TonB family protein
MKTMKTLIVLLALSCASLAASADIVDDWRRDQSMIEAQLQKKEYAAARKAAIKLANRIMDRFVASGEASRLLADTASLRAAVEEGLGHSDDAIWYKQVAAALDPIKTALAHKHPAPPPVAFFVPSAGMKAPEVIRHRPPVRPGIINSIGESRVSVSVVIDIDGIVRSPRILDSPAPAVSYAALETVHQWRFRPATRDGKPATVAFKLTIDFRLDLGSRTLT